MYPVLSLNISARLAAVNSASGGLFPSLGLCYFPQILDFIIFAGLRERFIRHITRHLCTKEPHTCELYYIWLIWHHQSCFWSANSEGSGMMIYWWWSYNISPLLAIVDKYGVPIGQWACLYQALSEVSMNKIALWINVCSDDWTAKHC